VAGVGDGLHFLPTPAFLVICYVSRVLELSRDQRLAFHCHYASQWTLHHRENTRLAQEVDDIRVWANRDTGALVGVKPEGKRLVLR